MVSTWPRSSEKDFEELRSVDQPRLRAEVRVSGTFDGGSISEDFKTVLP